ncbi:hypothetical protein IGI04_009447 [Brassica rapa subsp. trilocularis]|uniref:Uncharacterized protein n=1 Tax=Brassica rapa subsp. trilocularis TaxID=1813537 RepID=A0ABQ7MXD1_BRACM|nr:hypothetical protein IGI04_009447 [Brassica rapa subsp. trilocularis]
MGNYASCARSNITPSSSSSKVILPDGEVRHIHAPTKAAELMMEIPSFFLVDAKTLKIGRKLKPLAADDDLQTRGCHVYVAFPMTRATSAANASDMARLFLAAKKQQRRRVRTAVKHCHNGRISPEGEEDVKMMSAGSKLMSLVDIDEFSAAEFMHRISNSKSKKPKLETIAEEESVLNGLEIKQLLELDFFNAFFNISNTTSSFSSSSSSKVILPDGEVRHIHAPSKAAELMMEIPSFFLVDAKTLKIGRKLKPLAADDDLETRGCHVYVAFPMTRATSAANASDMARLFLAAKKQQRRRVRTAVKHCHNGKISPEGEEDVKMVSAGSKLMSLVDIDEFSAAEFMHRISNSKSKKPKLETIAEEESVLSGLEIKQLLELDFFNAFFNFRYCSRL